MLTNHSVQRMGHSQNRERMSQAKEHGRTHRDAWRTTTAVTILQRMGHSQIDRECHRHPFSVDGSESFDNERKDSKLYRIGYFNNHTVMLTNHSVQPF